MSPKLSLQQVAVDRHTLIDGHVSTIRVVSDVTWELARGGRLSVFGPSGSGKTSLIRLLNRLDDPAQGRILLDGEDIRTLHPVTLRRRVGMVFQQPLLFDLPVFDNLAYPIRMQNQTLDESTAVALLEEFGLPADYLTRRGHQLSGGQQQRVAIARALVLNPEVLVLDEPSSALDEESAALLMEALLRRNAAGLTIIMVSHAREMMQRLNGQALLVYGGRAVFSADLAAAWATVERERVAVG